MSNVELNKLELELFFLLDFRVVVSSGVFESYCFHIEKEMAVNGTGTKIERALSPKVMDNLKAEISIEDKQSPSLPQILHRHHRWLFNVVSHTLHSPSLPFHALLVIGSFISQFLFFYLKSRVKASHTFCPLKKKYYIIHMN